MKKIWNDTKVDVKKLYLDLNNPRVPKYVKEHNDRGQVRNYLLTKEGLMRIARSIANNGYHRSAVAIVCREKGKLIVLDGNRRLAACQLLLQPKLASDARVKRELEDLNKKVEKVQLKKIKITIAPSRKEAEKEIWDIHVNQLSKPWEVLQKLRMYHNLINEGDYNVETASSEYGVGVAKFKKELSKLYFYEQILEHLEHPEKEEEELLQSGFNKIDRIILSSNGKKLLGYDINDEGNIVIDNHKEFGTKLKKLIPYIVQPDRIHAQISQDELTESVFRKIDPILFPKPKKKTGWSKEVNLTAKVSKKSTLAKPDWVTAGEYKSYEGAEKVKQILGELKEFQKPNEFKNILVNSLRVLLELALYHKLQETGHIKILEQNYRNSLKIANYKREKNGQPIVGIKQNWSPSFREMLNYCLDENNAIISSAQTREALSKMTKGDSNFIEDLNAFIHNVDDMVARGDPERIWSKFGRLLMETINKIT